MLMLAMFFAVALSMGHLTSRLRKREIAEHRRQIETEALLRVTQSAALDPSVGKGLAEALKIINSVVAAETALIVRRADHSFPHEADPASTFVPGEREFGVAAWAFANKQTAGRHTDTLPESEAIWFPLQTATSLMGVLGIKRPPAAPALNFTERQAVEAFALQLALVLEKEHFIQAVAHAEMMDKSDRLRRNLLDSVSHELKTPLAIIRAAIDGIGNSADPYVAEIDTASKRLQRLVESLLQMTRLESQVIEPQLEWCDAGEVIEGALKAAGDAMRTHPVTKTIRADLPLIKTDQTLLMQALSNILHNAAVYTPAGTPVEIAAALEKGILEITVRDHGAGLPAGEEGRLFAKFYRSPGSPAGGTGLGLSITRGFIQALGGGVACRNHPQGGAVFEIRLAVESLIEDEDGYPGKAERALDLS
jgi:two-component system sensor histidine kinase KdpD